MGQRRKRFITVNNNHSGAAGNLKGPPPPRGDITMQHQENAPRKPKKSHPWRNDAVPQGAHAARMAKKAESSKTEPAKPTDTP